MDSLRRKILFCVMTELGYFRRSALLTATSAFLGEQTGLSLSTHVEKVPVGDKVRHSKMLYSMTSSARARRDGETSMPSDRAARRLIVNSNLVACKTGRSAGLAPLRMLPT
jgi:hypothetical protein